MNIPWYFRFGLDLAIFALPVYMVTSKRLFKILKPTQEQFLPSKLKRRD